jgi:hypothetical protein
MFRILLFPSVIFFDFSQNAPPQHRAVYFFTHEVFPKLTEFWERLTYRKKKDDAPGRLAQGRCAPSDL